MKGIASPSRILVGTSGYSYTEWAEAGFYPKGTPAGRMLFHYAQRFRITELNYTWYQMPKPQSIDRMRQAAGPDFLFAAKLTRTMTHEIEATQWRDQVSRYRDGIAPLVEAGRLAAVLVQMPPSFDRSRENRLYLAALLDALNGLPVAVEFRHAAWAVERVFNELSARRVALVAVDDLFDCMQLLRLAPAGVVSGAGRGHPPGVLLYPVPRQKRRGMALRPHAETVRL